MVTINTSLAIDPSTAKTIGKIIVLHSTDDLNATAKDMATYEHRVWKSAETFVHYGVDDQGAYQVGQPGYVAWGAGNVNKYAVVQIELCEFSDKARSLAAYKNWVALAKAMAAKYGVPLTLDSADKTAGFKSHNWCSKTYGGSDHTDPYGWLTSIGISKEQLAKDLTGSGAVSASTTVEQAGGISASAAKLAVDGYWGVQLTKALQKLYGTTQDGVVSSQYNWKNAGLTSGWQFVLPASAVKGSLLIAAVQRALGVKADGELGPETIKAMQRKAGTPVDGVISAKSQLVMYMQRCANIGKKPF